MKKSSGFFVLMLCYLPVLAVQWLAANVTIHTLTPWYADLIKASWNPPSWVFGPVWTLLYIIMTISVWLIYRDNKHPKKHGVAYTLFFVQLTLNGLWSYLFFGWHYVGLALLDLALLFILVGFMMVYFFRLRKSAGYLLLPYFLWSGYALTLNAAIWWLNG